MRPRFRSILLIGAPEPLRFEGFLAIRADDADAGERFLRHGADLGELRLNALESAMDDRAEMLSPRPK